MQIQNIQIYSAAQAVSSNGPWIDVSNLVSLSVQVNTPTAVTTDIEVSNDPNVMIDGAGIGVPSAAPTLSQFAAGASFQSGVSFLPAGTYFVKTTFITKWGETQASAESSLAVTEGNYLYVAAQVPTAGTQAPFVTGYNVYVSTTTGTEVLQTTPGYSPQRLIDGIGSTGGTVYPLGPGQSTHFAISGAIPISYPGFSMINGYQNTGLVVPSSDTSGGTNSGVSVSNNGGLSSLTGDNTAVATFINTAAPHNIMWSPSSMTWKYLRVIGGGALTIAYLCGQRG